MPLRDTRSHPERWFQRPKHGRWYYTGDGMGGRWLPGLKIPNAARVFIERTCSNGLGKATCDVKAEGVVNPDPAGSAVPSLWFYQ